jgi:superfamily II DNA or RNA helicase
MTYDRFAIKPACERSGTILRPWQRQALHRVTRDPTPGGIITAIMGAGKSRVIALLCVSWQGPVVVTCPTIALVEQLAETIEQITGETVGRFYTGSKTTARVTVVCAPSIPRAVEHLSATGLLWVADECHRTERDAVAPMLGIALASHVGFSATPYLTEEGETLSAFTHEIMRYTVADALRDGALVPMRVEFPVRPLREKLDVDAACLEWIARADGPGIVSARDILDVEDFAQQLVDAGIPALPIHSRAPRSAVRSAIAALNRGDVRVLVHCRMLVEGVDLPWLRWLCLRAPRGSRVAYSQEIGRVLRASPGKDYALIFDPFGKTLEYQLQDVAAVSDAIGRPESQTVESAEPQEPLIDPLTGEEFESPDAKDRRSVASWSASSAYMAQCVIALATHGVTRSGNGANISGVNNVKGWRFDRATDRQIEVLAKAQKQARFVVANRGDLDGATKADAAHLRAIALIASRAANRAAQGDTLRRGPVSDIITVLLSTVRTPDRDLRSRALAAIRASGVDAGMVE